MAPQFKIPLPPLLFCPHPPFDFSTPFHRLRDQTQGTHLRPPPPLLIYVCSLVDRLPFRTSALHIHAAQGPNKRLSPPVIEMHLVRKWFYSGRRRGGGPLDSSRPGAGHGGVSGQRLSIVRLGWHSTWPVLPLILRRALLSRGQVIRKHPGSASNIPEGLRSPTGGRSGSSGRYAPTSRLAVPRLGDR